MPDIIQQSEALPYHLGGFIYEADGASSQDFDVQERLHLQHGHPFHPWRNEDKLWLADFIFRKAGMSSSVTNNLLDGFRDGWIKMDQGELSLKANKQLMKQLDRAEFISVSFLFSL